MKINRLVALGLAVFWILPTSILMAESKAPDAVVQAATQGLKPWLDKIPASSMLQFGFDPTAPLDSATLGAPFLVHTITPAALKQYKSGTAVTDLITPTTLWYFPVLVAGEAKAILVVDRMNDRWEAVSLGYSNLAGEWANVTRQWPESKGYHPVLIAVFQAKQHLFTVPEKGAANLTPLASGQQAKVLKSAGATGARYSTLDNADSVIQNLIPAVENNLQSNQ